MASEQGRGAQVRLDDTARALARGGNASRLIDNIRAKAALEAAGTAPSGLTPDGSTGDGTAADDEVLLPGGTAGSIAPTVVGNGSGATTRTVQEKTRDTYSVKDYGATGDGTTDDTTAVTTAVARAFAAGALLEWPNGAYLTTASIPALHSVRHLGPGARILRGTDTFWVDPIDSKTNTLYAAPGGSSSNDGLSTSQPFALASTAVSRMQNYGPELAGTWQVLLSAGTYNDSIGISPMKSKRRILIAGPAVGHPNVPTAIIDKGATAFTRGVGISNYVNIEIRDIKTINFKDASDPNVNFGLDASTYADVWLTNVHHDQCDTGRRFTSFSKHVSTGGIISNCTWGVLELFGVVRDFKGAGSLVAGTQISTCTYGVFAKELCTGHLDYVTISDCTHGVRFSRASTANISNGALYRNTYGIVLGGSCHIVDIGTDYGVGTANKNTVKILYLEPKNVGRGNLENAITAPFVGMREIKIGYDYTAKSITGSTVDRSIFASLGTLYAGDFQAAGSHVRMVVDGLATLTGAADIKFRVGNSNASVITMPIGTYNFRFEAWLRVTSTGDVQAHRAVLWRDNGNPLFAAGSRTYTFSTLDLIFNLNAQLTVGTDTLAFTAADCFSTEG